MPSSKRAAATPPADSAPQRQGKGRPTPTRKQAEAARRRGLVATAVPGGDKKARKAALREQRMREQQAMLNGDERYLPARDKGPVRRMARDIVDSRRNFGDYFVWFALGLLGAMFLIAAVAGSIGQTTAFYLLQGLNVLTMLVALAAVVDGWLLSRRLRRMLEERFGATKIPRGTVMYGVLRAYQMRRMRLPRPGVERGQQPR